MLKERDQHIPRDRAKIRPDVCISYPADLAPFYPEGQGIKRIVRPTPRSEPVTETKKLHLVNRCEDHIHNRLLDDLVLQRRDPERSCPAVRFGYLYPPNRRRPARSPRVSLSAFTAIMLSTVRSYALEDGLRVFWGTLSDMPEPLCHIAREWVP